MVAFGLHRFCQQATDTVACLFHFGHHRCHLARKAMLAQKNSRVPTAVSHFA
jgi:hypothetical protein